MDPSDDAVHPLGKTVLEVLIEKHPEQRIPNAEDFLLCDSLPAMIQPTITNARIKKSARKLSGSAGIRGFDSLQLQRVLMRFNKSHGKIPMH